MIVHDDHPDWRADVTLIGDGAVSAVVYHARVPGPIHRVVFDYVLPYSEAARLAVQSCLASIERNRPR